MLWVKMTPTVLLVLKQPIFEILFYVLNSLYHCPGRQRFWFLKIDKYLMNNQT